MSYRDCIGRLSQAAGRQLSDDEARQVFERIHKAALDIKSGRKAPSEVTLGKKLEKQIGAGQTQNTLIQEAADKAAMELAVESAEAKRQAHLQIVKLSARKSEVADLEAAGLKPLKAVDNLIYRDYSGKTNIESLEQRMTGLKTYFLSKIEATWDSLGNDFLGFFQNKDKLEKLLTEMFGESTGDPMAAKGAKAWLDVAEEQRQMFNANGGHVGKLDESYLPQGWWNQEFVARASEILGKGTTQDVTANGNAFVDYMLPILKKTQAKGKYYIDDLGNPWPEAQLRQFIQSAWDTMSTDGINKRDPGGATGVGKRANRHAEHRQIHFPDAKSMLDTWGLFGGKTPLEILYGHVDSMARDIAFVEKFGPSEDMTWRTLRDDALKRQVMNDRQNAEKYQAEANRMDDHWEYVRGRTSTTYRPWLRKTADGIANLNVAGKLGSAVIASLFGDKPMYEAVSHLNNIPEFKRWQTELSILNPKNVADRHALMREGLMVDTMRSGLQRFYEGLGQSSRTGKLANAVVRATGLSAINDLRKGTFGAGLFSAIGLELSRGKAFNALADSDVRALRHFGITESDWKIWRLAKLDEVTVGQTKIPHSLTPSAIERIPDASLKPLLSEGQTAQQLRRDAVVKLLGVVNTESEFAIVTPGLKERAQFYSGLASKRGTVMGEIARSALQFKSFPWAFVKRGMDAIANMDTPASKAAMTAYLVAATTLAGAMIMQTREMLAGKDPRSMTGDKAMNFWTSAFIQGGGAGIYGDFIYGAGHTRYGSGILETMSGPTLGPLLEMGLVQPIDAIAKAKEGKDTHFLAQEAQDLKGFIPGGNMWFTKAALDHMIFQQVFEALSPGYLSRMKTRTRREYGQGWWWEPGQMTPNRAPDLGSAAKAG